MARKVDASEEWRDIPGYEGCYQASSVGRVRSSDREYFAVHPNGRETKFRLKGKVRSPSVDRYGYLSLILHKGNKSTRHLVSRLVCLAFHGAPPSPTHEAAHWDGNRLNNKPTNLRWATPQENADDKARHGTVRALENHPRAKLTRERIQQVKQLRQAGATYREISELFGVAISTLSSAVSGQNWGGGNGGTRTQA